MKNNVNFTTFDVNEIDMAKKYDFTEEKNDYVSDVMATYTANPNANRLPQEYSIVQNSRRGVLFRDLLDLLDDIKKSLGDIAPLLIVSLRTLQRYTPDKNLPTDLSEKILEIRALYERGKSVFEHPNAFIEWMDAPNYAMGGLIPFSLLDTHTGIGLVKDSIGRIEHGVFG